MRNSIEICVYEFLLCHSCIFVMELMVSLKMLNVEYVLVQEKCKRTELKKCYHLSITHLFHFLHCRISL